ncbi:putative P-loop ATPase/phage/plasmid primase-like uncharacterized protein [Burkholderia ambifaria]|nr:VapE domain-containing protein [Burkholderia ambifaria]MDR6503556.1 putative P-loop ATPase/phage/plasmid primase-like uncharacterized protein [Burkholderia ambifaria]
MHDDLNTAVSAAGTSVIEWDAIEDFCDAMADKDIRVKPGDIVADGKLHRIHADGDGKNVKDAWFVLHIDDRPAGKFGHNGKYGYDVSFSWTMKVERAPMGAAEKRAYREKMDADRARREADEAARHAAAAELAIRIWDSATPIAGDDHPYLQRKGIQSYGLRVGTWEKVDQGSGEVSVISKNALLVPIWAPGKKIHSLQAILPDAKKLGRDKDYLSGANKHGHYFSIGRPVELEGRPVILICEGYATGASLHAATGHAVIVAFDAPNLLPVAELMRANYPDATIVVCADNDQWTLKPVKNPGLTRANEVRDAVGALVALPQFDASLGVANDAGKIKGPNDFNDLAQLEGGDAVRRAIGDMLNPQIVAKIEVAPVSAVDIAPWEDVPGAAGAAGFAVLDAPADGHDLPSVPFAQSAPMLPAAVPTDKPVTAKDSCESDPCTPIAMGQSGELYAFWTHARKVELIKSGDLFRDAGIMRLQDLAYWQAYCVASGVAQTGKDKYDRTMVGNMLMQKCNRVGALGAHTVPESVATPSEVDLQINLAMMHAKGSAYSIAQVLRGHPDWRGVVWFNEFAERIEARRNPPSEGGAGRWTDKHDMQLGAWLSAQYGVSIPGARIVEAVALLAETDKRHPVRDYLNGLEWDGESRLDSWLTTYAGCEDNTYTRNVGAKTLIGAVARIMKPGEKFDTTLVLEGVQGLKKSTLINALAPNDEWYTDNLEGDLGSKDAAIGLKGKWLIEVPELASLSRTRVEVVKSFLTRKVDDYRAPHARRNEDHPRQCAFFGTINPDADGRYLTDTTGGRRFWPVECRNTDVDGLKAVRDQLWAEAAARYAVGEHWWLTPEVEALAKGEQAERQDSNAWDEHVERFLTYLPPIDGNREWGGARAKQPELVTTGEIFAAITGRALTKKDTADSRAISTALRNAGWSQGRSKGRYWIRE